MIWSPFAWNYDTGGLGCWVMNVDEAEACLERRRQPGGDLHPDAVRREMQALFERLRS